VSVKWPSPLIRMRHRLFIDSSREMTINSRDWLSSGQDNETLCLMKPHNHMQW